jgi:hypothetical protein
VLGSVLTALACDPEVRLGMDPALDSGLPPDPSSAPTTAPEPSGSPPPPTTPPPPTGGLPPPLQWTATFEKGDLSEWLTAQGGFQNVAGSATLEVSSERGAQSSGRSLRTSVDAHDALTQAIVGRDFQLENAIYSVWYYLPEKPTTDYWVILKLSGARAVDRFDVDLQTDADGQTRLRLYEHGAGNILEPSPEPVPIGRWFQVKVFYRSTPDAVGFVRVEQDGRTVIDTGLRATALDAKVTFMVGSATRYVAPSPMPLFIDSVSVTEVRD